MVFCIVRSPFKSQLKWLLIIYWKKKPVKMAVGVQRDSEEIKNRSVGFRRTSSSLLSSESHCHVRYLWCIQLSGRYVCISSTCTLSFQEVCRWFYMSVFVIANTKRLTPYSMIFFCVSLLGLDIVVPIGQDVLSRVTISWLTSVLLSLVSVSWGKWGITMGGPNNKLPPTVFFFGIPHLIL